MDGVDALTYAQRAPAGAPEGMLVLLHGRAHDERSILPLADRLDPTGRLLGVCPRGPCPMEEGGAQWYRRAEADSPDLVDLVRGARLLADWLRALSAHTGIAAERTVVGGFSQGAVMTWALARLPDAPRPAGVLALSGFVPEVPAAADDRRLAGLPIFIAHGGRDSVIPPERGREAMALARDAGAWVEFFETPVPHTVDPRIDATMADWLRRTLP
jgi:phospholipase/carboxylesterase